MIKSKTVFVIGAGASADFGLPVGDGLKTLLIAKLAIEFEEYGRSLRRGDETVVEALRLKSRVLGDPLGNVNRFLPSARSIAANMPLALSIDNYLNDHSDDIDAIIAAKLAITISIIEAERKSVLHIDRRHSDVIDFSKTTNSWLAAFFQIAQERVHKNDVRQIFDNISFVCFNYDRCIEQYLYYVLQQYYRINSSEAEEIIRRLSIVHPYGMIGNLPWLNHTNSAEFGEHLHASKLSSISDSIRTFTESVDDGIKEAIKKVLKDSLRIVFLGFGYHQQNIDLLTVEEGNNIKELLGTAYKIPSAERVYVDKSLYKAFPAIKRDHSEFTLESSLAAEMLSTNRRRLQS